MPNINTPYTHRVYIQLQTAVRGLSNVSGTWNNVGAQFLRCPMNGLSLTRSEPKTPQGWMHGSRSPIGTILGRKSGSWSLSNIPICPSGTANTAPDMDPLLQAIFGAGGAGSTPGTPLGTAYQYGFADQGYFPFTLFDFAHNQPSVGNQYAQGCVVSQVTISLNGPILELSASGPCVSVVRDQTFTVQEPIALGGISSFPLEPGSFNIVGGEIPGFGAQLDINTAQFIGQCDAMSITINTGLSLKGDYIDDPYPAQIIAGARSVSGALSFQNNDSASLLNLKQAASGNSPVPLTLALGVAAGFKFGIAMNGMQFSPENFQDEGSGWVACNFGQAEASVRPGNFDDIFLSFN